MKDAVAVIARFAAVIAVALLLGLAPGVAGAQSAAVVGTPTNLTATPGVGAVYLDWTPPANAEYHFVAWLPIDAVAGDFRIRPVGAEGTATIAGLTPGRTYFFTVIAGRWEWSAADFGAKWSGWSPWVTAPALSVPLEADPTSIPGVADRIESSSTSASAGVKLTLTIGNLPRDMEAGSSIELYLEDDFKVPDSIDRGSVYFTVANPRTAATYYGGRVYATDPIEIDTDGHFTADKDDYAIQVVIPDMNTADRPEFDGFQGPARGQTLKLVFTKEAGIKNPSEAGTHSVGYSVLSPNDDWNDGPQVQLGTVSTLAKISLSDVDNVRGYELTVTGSGFNNGTSAAVHVLADSDVPQDLATMVAAGGDMEAQACALILTRGHRAGVATVGSDDRVVVEFEVTVPIFKPGNQNFLCMVDGEGRTSGTDVEDFDLEPYLRVSPTSVTVGDTVSIFGQDFPNPGAALTSLRIANVAVFGPGSTPDNRISVYSQPIGNDGSAMATFRIPGSVSGTPLEGTIRIDATWGDVREDAKITVIGPILRLSAGEARANESITIQGEDFSSGQNITVDPVNITIDGVPLLVDSVEVSNDGRFTVIVHLWSAVDYNNPALIPGTHTIGVSDSNGFYGTASIVIKEPSLKVTPGIAGPQDLVTIGGTDWPVNNPDSDALIGQVQIQISAGADTVYAYAMPDANGRFSINHRVRSDIPVPANVLVIATYGSTELIAVSSFDVRSGG